MLGVPMRGEVARGVTRDNFLWALEGGGVA